MINQAREKFEKVLNIVIEDMGTVRAGVAKPSMVEMVLVDAYGSKMKLAEVATITTPDPTMIQIAPWDRGLIKAVEKGIMESDLGLNPSTSGDVVRVFIPALTQERRQDFVKLVKQKLESGRVMIRSVRQEIKDSVEKQKGQAGVSEDDIERDLGELDKITGEFTQKLEKIAADKEAEIMKI